MPTISEAFAVAEAHFFANRLHEAEQTCRQILTVAANHHQVLHLLGTVCVRLGNYQGGVESFERALALAPGWIDVECNLGVAYRSLGKFEEAIACYRRALAREPDFAAAHNNLGEVFKAQGKLDDAVASYRRALACQPDYFDAMYNLGSTLHVQEKLDEAGSWLKRAVERSPEHADAQNNLGAVYKSQGKLREAAVCFRRSLQLKPHSSEAYNNLGAVFKSLERLDDAAECYRRALVLKPDTAEAHANLGGVLHTQGHLEKAVDCYEAALRLKPNIIGVACQLTHLLQQMCQWDRPKELGDRVIKAIEDNAPADNDDPVSPFAFLALPAETTAQQQWHCAQRFAKLHVKTVSNAADKGPIVRPSKRASKIVVGYLSNDFRDHSTSYLMAELFEKHDRGRFEIVAYSFGPDDQSAIRQRIIKSFDRFVDIKEMTFMEAARRIAAEGTDILVDLKGHTAEARTEILACRAAPIQVNYLGYPGTMGATFMDYILVDDFIVPAEQQPYFTENLVHLPGCYQVNDSRREIAERTPSRTECGLPEEGFVFCAFNNSYKITPPIFDVWMRLLKAVPGSVLWVFEGNRISPANLRREAEARGVAPQRLVFAASLPQAEHLARHRLADLFLDTFPYNSHTTASDALWAGCPLLTIVGKTFVSRVAASVVRAIGLPELITTTLEEYEAMGLRLARDPRVLGELRERLARNRTTSPLFDAGVFARNLEKAFVNMWSMQVAGEKPRSFAVT